MKATSSLKATTCRSIADQPVKMTPNLVGQANGKFGLVGDLKFETVTSLHADSKKFLSSGKAVSIDMSKVGAVDSAGVVMLVDWLQQSDDCGVELQFENIPEQASRLIQVSGLAGLFPGLCNSD